MIPLNVVLIVWWRQCNRRQSYDVSVVRELGFSPRSGPHLLGPYSLIVPWKKRWSHIIVSSITLKLWPKWLKAWTAFTIVARSAMCFWCVDMATKGNQVKLQLLWPRLWKSAHMFSKLSQKTMEARNSQNTQTGQEERQLQNFDCASGTHLHRIGIRPDPYSMFAASTNPWTETI